MQLQYGLYSPSSILTSIYATQEQAQAAAPSSAWAVYPIEIIETGIAARNIRRILGHEPGYKPTPASIKSTP